MILTFFYSAVTGYIDNNTKTPPQLITGLGTGAGAPWMVQSRLAILKRTNDTAGNSNDPNASQDEVMEQGMAEASTLEAAIKIVEDALVARIAKAISTSPEDIDVELPLYTYGVDSLIAVEIRNWTMTRLKSEVSIFDILSALPIKDLAAKMATGSQLLRVEARQQEHSEKSGGWLDGNNTPAAHVEVPEEKKIKETVRSFVHKELSPALRNGNGVVTFESKAIQSVVGPLTMTLEEVNLTPATETPPPSYNVVMSQ
jgi:hypothetical protein